MREERLIERLINQSQDLEPRFVKNDVERLRSSVSNHLIRLLNTKQGTVSGDPEYGLPDFSNLPGNFISPETEAIKEKIKELIETYEPRLKDVAVSFEGSSGQEMALKFGLSATIYHMEHIIPFRMRTRMRSDSTFNIEMVL
ncbi:MAG: type VI secretion system baseplate subunit TssE [SAR324 cluster bacterium]|nr:type VI secretion system baseplate subunit TssE [SAR324 cluster bacterium]